MTTALRIVSSTLASVAMVFALSGCSAGEKLADAATEGLENVVQSSADGVALRNAEAAYRELGAVVAFDGGAVTEEVIDARAGDVLTEGSFDPTDNSVRVLRPKNAGSESMIEGVAYLCATGASSTPCM